MSNVALLIDWENIKANATKYLKTPPDIITLKKIARRYGSLRIGRAYANWTEPSGWHAGDAERLAAQGIEPVYVATKHRGRSQTPSGDQTLYEKDLVDLRLACDGMELLTMHPEIECFVVVSGDGALETLLAKLSARSKRVVRVAVTQSLPRRMSVLGEERVQYDDWIKGFRLAEDESLNAALNKFAETVRILRESGADTGLHSVKAAMRRDDNEFEEESLGIPTFRHLAYLAEGRGLVRIDACQQPARAYLASESKTTDGRFLPDGATWSAFIRLLGTDREFNKVGLLAAVRQIPPNVDGQANNDLHEIAEDCEVLTLDRESYVTQDKHSADLIELPSNKYRLNAHHPRVQVAMASR